MHINHGGTFLIFFLILIVIIIIIIAVACSSAMNSCNKSCCMKKYCGTTPPPEGYVGGLESDYVPRRSPVDYYSDYRGNPHYKLNPWSKYKPFEDSNYDFYSDERKNRNFPCCDPHLSNQQHVPFHHYPPGTKSRFDLANIGKLYERRDLEHQEGSMWAGAGPYPHVGW